MGILTSPKRPVALSALFASCGIHFGPASTCSSFADPKSLTLPQPVCYSRYERRFSDHGGVHSYPGVSNSAFYAALLKADNVAWDGVEQSWFRAMTDPNLWSDSKFAYFVALTIVLKTWPH